MQGILIVGPTGVGKTELALLVAEKLKCPIISCDSMQVYKGLDIGTAKATQEEQQRVKHYMIDVAELSEKYSVGRYILEVVALLKELSLSHTHVVVVGGTGLYAQALVEGLAYLPIGDEGLRKELSLLSLKELQQKLKEVDFLSYEHIDIANPVRIIRALEVFYITGKSFYELSRKNQKNHDVSFKTFILNRSRYNLYDRIDLRVKKMIEQGLEKEAKFLYDHQREAVTALQGIGYREFFEYFNQESSMEQVIENIQQHSRNYAKRQLTWFRRMSRAEWIDMDINSSEMACKIILETVEE